MTTPLMLILSCLRADYKIADPISLADMSRKDQLAIREEAKRLCHVLLDENEIYRATSATGLDSVYTTQVIGNKMTEIHTFTAYTLTHLVDCARHFLKTNMASSDEDDENLRDLSGDSVVLRIEGNPNFAYMFVYSVMKDKAPLAHRVGRIESVYSAITTQASTPSTGEENNPSILEAQSKMSYWARLWTIDSIKFDGIVLSEKVDSSIFQTVRDELASLGFAGFINPLALYRDFSSSRVGRKTVVNIPVEIVNYLARVVQSGGGSIGGA